jgi:hypothetical protein
MISHRNMIFSTSQVASVNEEIAKVHKVRCPYLRRECKDNSRHSQLLRRFLFIWQSYLGIIQWAHMSLYSGYSSFPAR